MQFVLIKDPPRLTPYKMKTFETIKDQFKKGIKSVITEFKGEEYQMTYTCIDGLLDEDKQDQDHYSNGVMLRDEQGNEFWAGNEELNLPKFTVEN